MCVHNFLRNLTVKELCKSVHICRSYDQKSSVLFFDSRCIFVQILRTCLDLQYDVTFLQFFVPGLNAILFYFKLESFHWRSHRPLQQHFSAVAVSCKLRQMTLTFELNGIIVKANQHAKYRCQKSFSLNVIVRTQTNTRRTNCSNWITKTVGNKF